jgi:hypothetical protein
MTAVQAANDFAINGSLESLLYSCRRLEGLHISLLDSEVVKVLTIVERSFSKFEVRLTAEESETFAGIVNRFVDIFDRIGRSKEYSLSWEAFDQLVAFTNAIRSYSRWQVNVPLIIWPRVPDYVTLFPNTFHFCEHSSSCVSVIVNLSEIETLVHSTNATNLLSILDLNKFGEPHRKFRLKVNRDSEVRKQIADVTTGGLLYCGFQLPDSKKQAIQDSYANDNGYGSCVLKIEIEG